LECVFQGLQEQLEVMKKFKNISGGIYLIADAGLTCNVLIEKLREALIGGVSIVQLYNTENKPVGWDTRINVICDLCHQYGVPVLVNNDWALLNQTLLDGVHFDKVPADYHQIEKKITKEFYKGITCSNDLSVIEWATENRFDYASFCSLFPSPSVGACEIVSFETIKRAREITTLPLFVAGGINLNNINRLTELPVDGVAVISGIMGASDIRSATEEYTRGLAKIIHHAN
jgi:thiamine-phosphate pyrophosphorylase